MKNISKDNRNNQFKSIFDLFYKGLDDLKISETLYMSKLRNFFECSICLSISQDPVISSICR